MYKIHISVHVCGGLAPRLEGSGHPGIDIPHEYAQPLAPGKDGESAPLVILGAAKLHMGQAKTLSQAQGTPSQCHRPPWATRLGKTLQSPPPPLAHRSYMNRQTPVG